MNNSVDRGQTAIDALDRLVSRHGGETEREALNTLGQFIFSLEKLEQFIFDRGGDFAEVVTKLEAAKAALREITIMTECVDLAILPVIARRANAALAKLKLPATARGKETPYSTF